jgi:uncharacterized protein (DUF433 family)
LSYLQLIEVGVVAAMRAAGVKLTRIKQAREYLSIHLGSRYPFAEYRFQTDGKDLFVSYDQIEGDQDKDKLLSVNQHGQLSWTEILAQRLREFDYDDNLDTVLRWRVAGVDSPVRIDPRVCFGAPNISGIPTWVIKGRWLSGEGIADIADDYDLIAAEVISALRFEGIEADDSRPNKWIH